MKILLTGGAGFIGRNILEHLIDKNRFNITVLDRFDDVRKLIAVAPYQEIEIADYSAFSLDERDFDVVIHQGAISATTEMDAEKLWHNNVRFSLRLAEYCAARDKPLIYASSASVYGVQGDRQSNHHARIEPLNGYGSSKLIVDNLIQHQYPNLKYFALRYFNVYGRYELDKGDMASPVTKFFLEAKRTGEIRLFAEDKDNTSTAFSRDFVFVGDICRLIDYLIDNCRMINSSFLDVGTGKATTFRKIASLIQDHFGRGVTLKDIPMPASLVGHYQGFTRADLSTTRLAGYAETPTDIETGVKETINWLSRVT